MIVPNKLTSLRFDQAANLVDDPANPKAVITLLKRVAKEQPAIGSTHVNVPDWLTKEAEYLSRAEQTSGERNALPDSAFAAVWTDADGRKQRKLPYRRADGAVDLPHLRNALSRLSQTDMPAELKPKARGKLEAAAASAGVGKSVAWLVKDLEYLEAKRRSFA